MQHNPHRPSLSIVLPCYNEYRAIAQLLAKFGQAGEGVDFELIFVDNGSTDGTPVVLKRLLPLYKFARSIRVDPNRGYGHGILSGLRAAKGQVLAWSHADLQTDPADVFRAFATLNKSPNTGRQIIKGRRYGRRVSERIISLGMQTIASAILRTKFQEINAQPKVFDRGLLDDLTDPPVDFNFDLYVLYTAHQRGWGIESIPVRFPPREYGQSNWAATWRSKVRTISRSIAYMIRLARRSGTESVITTTPIFNDEVCDEISPPLKHSRAA